MDKANAKRLTAAVIILAVMMTLAGCGGASGTSAGGPAGGGTTVTIGPDEKADNISGNIPEGSVLTFFGYESHEKLNRDMEEGRIPVECSAMYDEMGSRPWVVTSDPEIITEIYNRLGAIIVEGESDESITDCYHSVTFTLQDGTTASFSFEGTGLLSSGSASDYRNYSVSGGGSLWSLVRAMQDEIMENEDW